MDEKYDILPDIQNSLKLWCSQYDFHEPYNQQFHDFLYDTLRRVTDMINSEKNETEYTGFIKKWDKIDSLKKRKFQRLKFLYASTRLKKNMLMR